MPSIDPEMLPILERLRAMPAADYSAMPVAEARRLFDAASLPWNEGGPVTARRDLTIDMPGRAMRARLHLPSDQRNLPLIVFAHGGGWTFGSIDTHDANMRRLAKDSGCAVLGMDYRLAPEHPFPAPLDDVVATIAFAEGGALGRGVDPSRIALAGDSAGAHLALAALLRRRDEAARPLKAAALFYGCYIPDFTTRSHTRCGGGEYLLTTRMMRWYWRNFLGAESEETSSLAVPLRADLEGLPSIYLVAAGLDPLADDTTMLAERLSAAGVEFRFDYVPGVLHGYLRMAAELSVARETVKEAGRFLAERI